MRPKEFMFELGYAISQRDYYHVLVFQKALNQILLSDIESLEDLHTFNRYGSYLVTQIDATIFILKGITHLQQEVYRKNGVVVLITNNYFRDRNDEESYESKANQQLINLIGGKGKDMLYCTIYMLYCTIWVNKYKDAIFFHIGTNLTDVDKEKTSIEDIIHELQVLKQTFKIKLRAVQNEIRFREEGPVQDVHPELESLLSLITLQLFKGGEVHV